MRYVKEHNELWRSPARFVAVPAGRGSGKTELAKRRLVRYLPVIKEWGDPRYFYGAPTNAQAMRIAWRHLLELIPQQWISSVKQGVIVTKFGSELHVVGLDKPQRIEGVQWDGCVLDESCDLKPGIFDRTVLPMLEHRHGWCWRIGVPKRQGPSAKEYRKFFEDGLKAKDGVRASFTWPSSKVLAPEQLAWARQNLDSKDFREQFEAQWENAGGLIFYAFQKDYNVKPVKYDPTRPIVVGSDFNINPMAWVIGHRYENALEIFDELWLRDTNTQAALDHLWGRYGHHKSGWEFYGDAAGRARKTSAAQSDYQQILNDSRYRACGCVCRYPKANPLVVDRFAATNALACNAEGQRRLFVDPRCTHLIDDLENRAYVEGERSPDDWGDVGHITDALGYIIYKVFPIRVRLDEYTKGVATSVANS